MIPGFVINRAVAASGHLTKFTQSAPLKKWGPTAVGLATVPFIIHPIDTAVDWGMDRSVRLYFNKEGGAE
jgi:fission process protein 1